MESSTFSLLLGIAAVALGISWKEYGLMMIGGLLVVMQVMAGYVCLWPYVHGIAP